MNGRSGTSARGVLPPIEVCDRCGVRARLRVVLGNGGQLCFCSRHAAEYRAALKQVARSMEDIADWTDEFGWGDDDGRDDQLVVR